MRERVAEKVTKGRNGRKIWGGEICSFATKKHRGHEKWNWGIAQILGATGERDKTSGQFACQQHSQKIVIKKAMVAAINYQLNTIKRFSYRGLNGRSSRNLRD
jgi:hypothetical protein